MTIRESFNPAANALLKRGLGIITSSAFFGVLGAAAEWNFGESDPSLPVIPVLGAITGAVLGAVIGVSDPLHEDYTSTHALKFIDWLVPVRPSSEKNNSDASRLDN